MSQLLPVTLVTGFLGSGKTTFLNWLLSQPDAGRIAVVVNEFGEIGLDHLLIATPSENIVLLEGGCLCCEVRGDLVQTLTDLWDKREQGVVDRFDHVIVETTGLSNPVPIIQTLLCDESIRDQFGLNQVITLVDAVEFEKQLPQFVESSAQVAVGDTLLISKMDLCDSPEHVGELKALLRQINPGAAQEEVRNGIPQGLSAKQLLVEYTARAGRDFLSSIDSFMSSGKTGKFLFHSKTLRPAKILSDVGIESFSLRRPGEFSATSMTIWLNLLATMKGENLLRLKAILNVEGKPVAIHATQTIVHEPVQLEHWPSDDRDSRFVVISRGNIQQAFEASLDELDADFLKPAATPQLIDPAAYQNFIKIAEAFSSQASAK
jgi:G3E family GTPase